MKNIHLLTLLSILFADLQAQNFDWAKREGLWAYDYGYSITTDNNGNVYVAGKYEEVNANFSGTLVPCQGNHDIWLAQYGPDGTLKWIRTAGGSSGDYAWGIACDNQYVYIAGEVEGQVETITFVGSPITITCQASNDIFVAKYDINGTLLWAKRAGDDYYEKALGVTYDASGNVYICGLYNTKAVFGGTTTIHAVGESDMFIAKYDANGNFLWVQSAGSTGRDEAKSIKCDAAGNVYVCGMFSNNCAMGSQNLTTYNQTAYYDAFLAKFNPSGTLQWVKTGGGDVDDVAWSLTMDNAGKLYVSGEYNAYAPFDGTPLTSVGMADVFVACYDASGTMQWVKSAGGPLVDRARGIGCDGSNLVITGQFGATSSFGSFNLTSMDSSDVFCASLDNSGNFIAGISVSGPADTLEDLGYESGIAICAEANGNVYATGSILDGGVFGSYSFNHYGRTDAFVTKISQLTGIHELASNVSLPVYPNPGNGQFTIDLTPLHGQKAEATVYNCLGKEVNVKSKETGSTLQLDLSSGSKGIYFIDVRSENGSVSRNKIVLQ